MTYGDQSKKAAVHVAATGVLHQGRELECVHGFAGYRIGVQKEGSHIGEATPLPISQARSLKEALADFTHGLAHKNTLIIHEVDGARNHQVLHFYKVVAKQAIWRKNPQTGLSERYSPLATTWLFALPVARFEPKRPFDAFLDPASGLDPELIEGRAS